jgi:hypothetical protein
LGGLKFQVIGYRQPRGEMKEEIIRIFEESAKLQQRFAKEYAEQVQEVVELIAGSFTGAQAHPVRKRRERNGFIAYCR